MYIWAWEGKTGYLPAELVTFPYRWGLGLLIHKLRRLTSGWLQWIPVPRRLPKMSQLPQPGQASCSRRSRSRSWAATAHRPTYECKLPLILVFLNRSGCNLWQFKLCGEAAIDKQLKPEMGRHERNRAYNQLVNQPEGLIRPFFIESFFSQISSLIWLTPFGSPTQNQVFKAHLETSLREGKWTRSRETETSPNTAVPTCSCS